jgi:hypothetical protein
MFIKGGEVEPLQNILKRERPREGRDRKGSCWNISHIVGARRSGCFQLHQDLQACGSLLLASGNNGQAGNNQRNTGQIKSAHLLMMRLNALSQSAGRATAGVGSGHVI